MDALLPDFGQASIALSLLLGLLCVGRIRAYGIRTKASYLRLCLSSLYGGLIAAAASLLLYRLAGSLGVQSFRSWYGFFLLVGPIEEAAKLLGFRATRFFHGHRPGEAADGAVHGVIHMAAVALGFSLIENFLYANAGLGNGHLLWLRLLLATPAHILFSAPMGLAGNLVRQGRSPWVLPAGFAMAAAAHGIYNILCATSLGILLAPCFLACLWTGLLAALRRARVTAATAADTAATATAATKAVPDPTRIAAAAPRDMGIRWANPAFAVLGMGICAVWGLSHLEGLRPASLHPALSQTWQDSSLSLAYPRGWSLSVWTSGDGREVSLSLEAQGHAAMDIRCQSWEIAAEADAAEQTLRDLLTSLEVTEQARRRISRWGRYAGAGYELDLVSSQGRSLGLVVFAHSAPGRSFVAVELAEAAYLEPLRPGLELVRHTLRLKPRPVPPGKPGEEPGADTTVTRTWRTRPAPEPGG